MTAASEPGWVHVWHAALDRPAHPPEALVESLSSRERERAARLRFERDRRRYVMAHGFLRGLLARYLGCAPAAVALGLEASGKPRLAAPATLRFNLAHSGELAVAVVADGRDVGADVERVRALRARGLARRVLSARELAELGEERVTEADLLACWTRKEAVLKASGDGLRRDPATVEVGSGAAAAATLVTLERNGGGGGQWTVVSLAPADGYVAAVAARGPGLELCRSGWEWRVS